MKTKPLPDLDPSKGYLMSMTLENVRCFGSPAEKLDMSQSSNPDKPARWTVILGENGVGKTTVLRALALARSQNALLKGYSTITAEARSLTRSGKRFGNYKLRASDQKDWDVLIEGDRTIASIRRDSAKAFSVNLAAYGAGRAWRGSSEEESGSIDTLFDRDAQVRDPNDILFRFDYREKSEKLDRPSRFEAFRIALTGGILPDVTDLKMGFAANDRPVIEFKTKDDWIALDDMSWGYQVFAAFAADYASRLIEWYPNSKTPLAEPGICLVDELDLHMHPKWQREVIEHLSRVFPATQFIVTVHSPLVVQAAEDANLVVLKRYPDDPSRVRIDNDVEAIKGWRIDQVLTSDLFGLESSRPPSIERALEERRELLKQDDLSTSDTKRLKNLDAVAMSLSTPESSWEKEAQALVLEAAAAIKARA